MNMKISRKIESINWHVKMILPICRSDWRSGYQSVSTSGASSSGSANLPVIHTPQRRFSDRLGFRNQRRIFSSWLGFGNQQRPNCRCSDLPDFHISLCTPSGHTDFHIAPQTLHVRLTLVLHGVYLLCFGDGKGEEQYR